MVGETLRLTPSDSGLKGYGQLRDQCMIVFSTYLNVLKEENIKL
jgi:hypothetical protein